MRTREIDTEMQFPHRTDSPRCHEQDVGRRKDKHHRQWQQHGQAVSSVEQTRHGSRAVEESRSPISAAAGIRQRQEDADDYLQLEVHGPDGGLDDAELGAGEGVGGGDVGEEGLVDLGAEDEG